MKPAERRSLRLATSAEWLCKKTRPAPWSIVTDWRPTWVTVKSCRNCGFLKIILNSKI